MVTFSGIKKKRALKGKVTSVMMDQRGVTFIELVVVITIFSIIAGTLLLNFSRFGRNITLQNLAQDIALQINEAQKEAISGRTNDLLGTCNRLTSDCAPRYGVYIVADGGDNAIMETSYGGVVGKSLLTFFDYTSPLFPNYGMLDAGGNPCGSGVNTECLDNISLGQGNYVSEICVGLGNQCDPSTTHITQGLHIAFKRPFPDAIIHIDDDPTTAYNYARITVSSPNSDTVSKDIVVTGLGQISIACHPGTPNCQ